MSTPPGQISNNVVKRPIHLCAFLNKFFCSLLFKLPSGLLGKIGEMIAKHDPGAEFLAGFQDKVVSFLYGKKNKKCTTGV